MSYPDKEKHTDNQLDNVEASTEKKLNNQQEKPSSEDRNLEDTIPVGQLKWRKDEEYEQDTQYSLGLSPKKSPAANRDEKERQPQNTGEEEQSDHMNKKSGNKEKPGSKDAVLPFAPNNETSSAGRQLSLEDTLTPINFKEYSIDPALDQTEKDKEEFVEEEKKPSFVAKPGLMESDTPYQEKKENTLAVTKKSKFTSKREWEEQEKKQIPKWARIFWLPATLIFVLFAGLIIGHSIIGKQPVGDIFDIDMWIHIYKLMYG